MRTPDIRPVGYDHPDARRLIGEVQQEYVIRYGGPDETPVAHVEFSPPLGLFVILYDDGEPVATGGWRMVEPEPESDPGDPESDPAADVEAAAESAAGSPASPSGRPSGPVAELKRMYVVPSRRGRGFARAVLTHLEASAAGAGAGWLILETGTMQPEAIALYGAIRIRPGAALRALCVPAELGTPGKTTSLTRDGGADRADRIDKARTNGRRGCTH